MKNYKIIVLGALLLNISNITSQNIALQNSSVQFHESTSNDNLNSFTSSNLSTTTNSTVGLSTSGGTTVSASGAAVYQVPFTLPSGIKGSSPSIGLAYSSQSSDGIAGWGWNITGLSSITRVPTTLYHDGFIDPVDFDSNDRYALDGQRLILKSGTYGADGSVYQTENYSNIKVVAHGTSSYGANYGPSYFIVYNSDGSRFWYGNGNNSLSKLEWAISKRQDTQNNNVNYSYENSLGILLIKNITYGAQEGQSAPNDIQFFYKDRKRNDYSFVADFGFKNGNILDRIEIKSNGQLYRKYDLVYDYSSLDYERLSSITEQNSAYEALAPVKFAYDSTVDDLDKIDQPFSLYNDISAQDDNMINGDFDGDGKMDIVTYKKIRNTDEDKKIRLFKEIYENNAVGSKKWIGTYDGLFTSTLLDVNNKVMTQQGLVARKGDKFEFYDIKYGVTLKYTKQWNAPRYAKKSDDPQVLNITTPVNGGSKTESGFEVTASNIISNSASVDYKGADHLTLKEGFHAKPGVDFTGRTNPDNEGDMVPLNYLSGDFNGDGITDVIAISKPYSYKRNCHMEYDHWLDQYIEECDDYNYNYSDAYFINLDRRATSNFSKELGRLNIPVGNNDRLIPADFDGDGKTDILHFTGGKVYVYKLTKDLTLGLIEEKSDTGIDLDYPILPGDYNGDGKSDFAIATANGSSIWKFFISTGKNYTVFSKDIQVVYSDFSGGGSNYIYEDRPWPFSVVGDESIFEYYYIPVDFNNDGKTDIVYHKTITPRHFDTHSHQALGIVANFGMTSNSDINFRFTNYVEANNDGITKYGIPVYTDISSRRKGSEYAFICGKKIQAYDIKKDHRSDVCLIGNENNGIVTTMKYAKLDGNSSIYSAGSSQTYPFVDIANGGSLKVVEEVTQNASLLERKQRFRYYGAVANLEGLGFIGFTKFSRTNWEGTNVGTLWTTTENDPLKRNAPIKQWTISGANPSENEPTSFVSKTSYEYTTSLSSSKVFKNHPNKVITTNGLSNVTTTENLTYDSYYNLLSTNSTYSGGSSTTTFTYSNNTAAIDASYHAGRPTKKVISKTLGGDTFSTEEQYAYANNLVSEIKKKGNGTPWLTETFVYDNFGNITQKTLSGDGKQRTEKFKYSIDGRFMTEAEDIEGLKTTYVYNSTNGHLVSKTNPFGQTTAYQFDSWNRLIEEEDYIGNAITIGYLGGSTGNLKRTTTNSLGGEEEIYVNRWGWETKTRVRNVNNEWVDLDYEYDIQGRITRQSDPFTGGIRLWTSYYYDEYGRELSRTLPTGRTINLTYNGLTGTADDGVKTVTTTKDALGNIVQVQDPGGTVNYTYYANGANKTTDYGGHVITMNIDGWGRKTQMNDPSAGIYTYEYNIFGELTKETTPDNGETNMVYDDYGKTISKTISGNETNITSSYQYDNTTKLITNISSTDNINSKTFTYTYDYDMSGTHKGRLNFVQETTNHASFKKTFTYDSQGRIQDEAYYSKSLISGDENTVKIKNHFHAQSGGLNKVSDFNAGTILWKISTVNNRGQLTEVNLGNGIVKGKEYDQYGLPVKFKDEKADPNGVIALELDLSFDAQRGNLTSRHNKAFTGSENFSYDNLDRLTQISGAISHTKSYDPLGRITNNSAVGDYAYQTQGRYKLKEIELNATGDTYYADHALQQITYNAFKKPVNILEENKGRVNFEYGPMMNRTVAYYGGLDSNKENLRYKKTYSSIMPIEIVHDSNDSSTKIITYVGGDAYTAPIVHIKDSSLPSGGLGWAYLHRDYLGSILSITDSSANIVEQTHFGAWGKVEQFLGLNGATTFNYESSLLGRGYTGHEHFVSVGLIHMNGRMYDANLGRFLSPDNFVQDPYNTQSFNRFGYVWNNPLKYADPSGEALLPILIGALVGAYIGGTVANAGELNPFNWKWDGDTWKGVIIGAILGAITGESIHALLTGGKAFGIFATKVSVLTPLGTVGLTTNEARGLDFSWTTKAGGSGTIEDAIKFPEKKLEVIIDASGGHFITAEEFKRMEEGFWIDSLLAGSEYTSSFIDENSRGFSGGGYTPYFVGVSVNGAFIGGIGFDIGIVRDGTNNYGLYFNFNGNVGFGGGAGIDYGRFESTDGNTVLLEHLPGRSYSYDFSLSSPLGGYGYNYGGTLKDTSNRRDKFNFNNFGGGRDGYTSGTGNFSLQKPGKLGVSAMWRSTKTWIWDF
ncbi:RHS repeat-associated core domain-containing protein [Flavivirga spongiicola]|uniref:FG-GAP-like repeat-containing protein n=1 Tax=Flavivirga spongiicola TaxID=421621 RepID=A0ABU7XUY8_9FLAO|nr:RHS repeat-associated core domain-containing protein [Flavivirga sp. MEBiC05379]MDO5979397.1 RHS repeat-associated core domain-containing protein [Flavivirga sp. MEBiC05379]